MEFISEFVDFLLKGVFWYFVIGLLTMPLRQKMDQKRADLEETVTKLMTIVHRVSVEKHGEVFYWFDADSNEFLAQGASTNETIAHLKSRFPTHIFLVSTKDSKYKLSAPTWEFVPFESKSNT